MVPSVRTPAETSKEAFSDAKIFTSLAESRYLAGNADLFHATITRFRRQAKRRSGTLIHRIEEARLEERRQFGDTVHLRDFCGRAIVVESGAVW